MQLLALAAATPCYVRVKLHIPGLPWWSVAKTVLPVQGAWVQYMVRELDPTCRK